MTKFHAFVMFGVEAKPVTITATATNSSGQMLSLAGVPEISAKETRIRVLCGIERSECKLDRRVHVECGPLSLRKPGASMDLAIALAMLGESSEEHRAVVGKFDDKMAFIGGLSPSGLLRPVPGVLPMVLAAKACGFDRVVVPEESAPELASILEIQIYYARSLRDVLTWNFSDRRSYVNPPSRLTPSSDLDIAEIDVNSGLKRTLEIAAAGSHSLMITAPRGARYAVAALAGLLPDLTQSETIECLSIYSAANMLAPGTSWATRPPVRQPHHTASTVGLVGGGNPPRPGEATLAHRGILYLELAPEFGLEAMELLAEPLREKKVTVLQDKNRYEFPADFQLVAHRMPCPCGRYGTKKFGEPDLNPCQCGEERIARYRQRTKVLADRCDMSITMRDISLVKPHRDADNTAKVRERVTAAKKMASDFRQAHSRRTPAEQASAAHEQVTDEAIEAWNRKTYAPLTPRGEIAVMRVARTIARLSGSNTIGISELAEALCYREAF